jgi:RNA polymerase sigma-70 factor (ECF subfamily)
MGDSTDKLDRAVGFETFYNAHYLRISGYVRRRVPEHEAADVIAQVFTVAWRRFEQVPPPPEDRLWLFGVARHSVADYRRRVVSQQPRSFTRSRRRGGCRAATRRSGGASARVLG